MLRLFTFLTIAILGYAHGAYAGSAAAAFSVAVTVVPPGALTGKPPAPPPGNPAGDPSLRQKNGQQSPPHDSAPYERFNATDSPGKRGGIFP